MFSVISTGTCCRPLCTAIVKATISGVTIGATGPGADRPFAAAGVGRFHFLGQVEINERAFLD